MKTRLRLIAWSLIGFIPLLLARAEEAGTRTANEIFSATLNRIVSLVEPPAGTAPQTFSARLELTRAEGLPKSLTGLTAELAAQAPDHLLLSAKAAGKTYSAGRDRQQLWIYVPDKKFGVVASPGMPRFSSAPEKKDTTKLGYFKVPLPKEQIALLPILMNVEMQPTETLDNTRCYVLNVTPKPEAIAAMKLPAGQLKLWVRATDDLPAQIDYSDGKAVNVEVRLRDAKLSDPWPAEQWKIPTSDGDTIEHTALSHLTHFASAALSSLGQKIPPLGPATGARRVVATEGNGRLELIDGTRVLFLNGTPEEMGQQHGKLLKREIRDVVNHILYGIGVGSSFAKGVWFFGEIERAQSRLAPFIDERYLREMDALARASGCEQQEIRLANYFPELFHCSGFALFGEATVGGRMYHGRILDYLRGVGLEQNAVVMVIQPDKGNAWVNISYAGFTGSVTAMNEKHVAIGEMGGRGEGHWDGKPMAQLVREVMEKANTIDEAVDLMRKGPRTCEYYYVISDAKSQRAVGIAATPTKFETVWAGQSHPQLPYAIKDAVLMSAGDRYEALAQRVKAMHGKINAESARELMMRPVCMTSNIHSVLFEPDTLDFWVANADSQNVASDTRYTHYNLGELLKSQPDVAGAGSAAASAAGVAK